MLQNQEILEMLEMLKGQLSDLRQFLTNDSPLKIIKHYFYVTLKLLSFLRCLNICTNFPVI